MLNDGQCGVYLPGDCKVIMASMLFLMSYDLVTFEFRTCNVVNLVNLVVM
jgi:hypothetical protein